MGSFWHDLRHGARLLGRSRGFGAIALLTLALGIGGSTAIFSVVDGVLLQPLPYPHPNEIVRVFAVTPRSNRLPFSDPDFADLRSQATAFQGVAEYRSDVEPVIGPSQPVLVTVAAVSRDFFQVMGVSPYLGPGFPYAELRLDSAPVAMISYGFWQRYLGGVSDFQSHHLSISGHLITIVGVMPPGFAFPNNADLWFPREIFPQSSYRTGHSFDLIARLKDASELPAAQAESTAIARRLKQQYREQSDMTDATVIPLRDVMVGSTRPALLILFGAVGLLLLVACANVANLLLAQAAGRQRELAVRMAMGATGLYLARQFIAESLLLSLGGAALGVPIGLWGVRLLLVLSPQQLPRSQEVGLNWVVLVFAAALAALTAVGLGVVTAWRATTRDVLENLRGGERTQTGGASSYRLRLILMGSQVAVTLVLLVGAGLLGRSFFDLVAINPGFRTDRIVSMHIMNLWPENLQEKQALVETMSTLLERLRAVPGVQRVGLVSALPLTSLGNDGGYLVLNSPRTFANLAELATVYRSFLNDRARTGHADYRVADADYFRVMGIPLLRGRLFTPVDAPDGQHVAVVSQSFADRQWPGEDPLGRIIEFGNMDEDLRAFTIVGVVGDVRSHSLDARSVPVLYSYYRQRASNDYFVVIRSTLPEGAVIAAARNIERRLQPDWPVLFDTMERIVSASISDREFNLTALGVFAITALLVALMGVYGVASYLVAQRTKEIGVRIAIGADAASVVRMIAGESLRVIIAGAVIGLAAALGLTQLLTSLLFGVHARDPLTFIGVAILVVLTGLLACYIPARRAARVDPVIALRDQ